MKKTIAFVAALTMLTSSFFVIVARADEEKASAVSDDSSITEEYSVTSHGERTAALYALGVIGVTAVSAAALIITKKKPTE